LQGSAASDWKQRETQNQHARARTRAVHDLRITENTYETVEVIHAATLKQTPNYAALAN
jgi:hypothetical protein